MHVRRAWLHNVRIRVRVAISACLGMRLVKEQPPVGKPIRMVFAAAALAPVALLAACGSSGSSSSSSSSSASSSASAAAMQGPALPTAPATASASLTETGSTLLFPLISAWATNYQTLYKQLTITTGGTGSGTGLADAATGTVDIGASDAYLSSSAKSQTRSWAATSTPIVSPSCQ